MPKIKHPRRKQAEEDIIRQNRPFKTSLEGRLETSEAVVCIPNG